MKIRKHRQVIQNSFVSNFMNHAVHNNC
nr:palindromic element RPE3 domain-containing protein [Rickettsia tillamookensis]